jgi:PhnB protein
MASCLFSIMIDDCDKSYEQAVKAGAEPLSPPQDQFWGMRSAIVKDPFGYRWSFGQQIEEVSPDEMAKRAQVFFNAGGS